MLRPCTCDRVIVGKPYNKDDAAHNCRTCWLFYHNPQSNTDWGGTGVVLVDGEQHVPTSRIHGTHPNKPAAPTPIPLFPCVHLGEQTGERILCDTCSNNSKIKVHACVLHGTCTAHKDVGVACCKTCPDNTGRAIVINQSASGLGDALLGACAVAGLAHREGARPIRYKIGGGSIPFLQLFDIGCYDLTPHDYLQDRDVPNVMNGEVQLNIGYKAEEKARQALPRLDRYCRNLGGVVPVRPRLLDRARLSAACPTDYIGNIILAPHSAFKYREWPHDRWVELETILRQRGYRTLVLSREPDRLDGFHGDVLIGAPAETVTAAILRAGCVIGNDSGIAHLAGILGIPTLALCGPTNGAGIYGFYGSVDCVQANHLPEISVDAVIGAFDAANVKFSSKYEDYGTTRDRTLLHPDKLNTLRAEILRTNAIPGDLAEFGVYRGGSARVILQFASSGTLYLFDTFEGMPDDDAHPGGKHRAGDFADCSREEVEAYLSSDRTVFHQGVFPVTAPADLHFRFVHIDCDTMQSTWAALDYFPPRMLPGGVMVIDDCGWRQCPGVRAALLESGLAFDQPTPCQAVVRF